MRWMTRGDIDGFFGLALDNLVQLLVIDALCRNVLGFSTELVYGRILPGAAVSLLVGNLYYSWQAMKLARDTWRIYPTKLPDVCRRLAIALNHHEALSDAEACARIVIAAQKQGVKL